MNYSNRMFNYIQSHGVEQIRDGRRVKEVTNFSDHLLYGEIDTTIEVPSSFSVYGDIDASALENDRFTRRAITLFTNKDACLSALSIQYTSSLQYIITVIFRSSDVAKIDGDLAWVKSKVSDLRIKGACIGVELYFINAHYYE